MRAIAQKLFFKALIFLIYCTLLLISSPAYAFNDSIMGKSQDFVLSKMGKPDRVVELSHSEIRFIYGETREGSADWAEYYIKESYMITFKNGKAVAMKVSFPGIIDNDGVPRDFPRLNQYTTGVLKSIKPVVQKGASGKWAGVRWNGSKYNYWARCIIKDISYDKNNKGFQLKEIKNMNEYHLVQYEIVENNYYREVYD